MAKNSKPRKKYKPRAIRHTGCYYPRYIIDDLKSIVNDVNLVVELTLPRGEATDDHMHRIQDLLNWGGMMLFDRPWKGQEAEVRELQRRHYEALHAFSHIVKRKKEGRSAHYVAKADELATLRDVCAELGELLKEAIEVAPNRTITEFIASKNLVEEEHKKREERGEEHGIHELNEGITRPFLDNPRIPRTNGFAR